MADMYSATASSLSKYLAASKATSFMDEDDFFINSPLRSVMRASRRDGYVAQRVETNSAGRPEGGAATVRFLVLQHERRRRAALGPREQHDHQPFQVKGNFNCDQKPFGM
jgi:hypothetical protein